MSFSNFHFFSNETNVITVLDARLQRKNKISLLLRSQISMLPTKLVTTLSIAILTSIKIGLRGRFEVFTSFKPFGSINHHFFVLS